MIILVKKRLIFMRLRILDKEKIEVINPLKDKTPYGWHFEQNVYDPNGMIRAIKAGGGSGNIPKVIIKKRSKK